MALGSHCLYGCPQGSEAWKQEVHVRFRNHCELISVLSNVRPGPADTEGGWREDDGDDEGRHAPFLSLSSATPTIQCGTMAKVTDLHNVLMMLGHF